MLLKPFTAQVSAAGMAVAVIGHTLSNLRWKIYQIGIGLGQTAVNAQVAAHVNGLPLAATVQMQPSVFSNIPGQAPYAMESFLVGPPYIILSSGDQLSVGVQNAVANDILTCAAYIDELDLYEFSSLGS